MAASLASFTTAQLPRECFYVTELKDPHEDEAELLSNLPTLMAMFKPSMRLQNIVVLHDDKEDSMSGLQLNLSGKDGILEMPSIGSRRDEWSSQKFIFDDSMEQPDGISILQHPNYGVCDVIIYRGEETHSLGNEPYFCQAGNEMV